ncbi:transposase [Streptomyces europaeiscabiei]|uniref:transposase n=1 Tax=Streptomyces europaeiscabiei TaxID=146819 RepID=UPI0029A802E9|nr:transposase [Streptomyces europaeiscabiei]MDX3837966.1 transposase [Streptomyces europaeiscabiei]
MVEARRADEGINVLMEGIRGSLARIQPWLTAACYIRAVLSDLPKRNGWTIAEWIGHRSPDRVQRLLNQASWDTGEVMRVVRGYVIEGLDAAAPARSMTVGALDETGQEEKGQATAGVKRQHMGCADGVANGINTVHLSYVRGGAGHALIGCRQWIPAVRPRGRGAAARTRGPPPGPGVADDVGLHGFGMPDLLPSLHQVKFSGVWWGADHPAQHSDRGAGAEDDGRRVRGAEWMSLSTIGVVFAGQLSPSSSGIHTQVLLVRFRGSPGSGVVGGLCQGVRRG